MITYAKFANIREMLGIVKDVEIFFNGACYVFALFIITDW